MRNTAIAPAWVGEPRSDPAGRVVDELRPEADIVAG